MRTTLLNSRATRSNASCPPTNTKSSPWTNPMSWWEERWMHTGLAVPRRKPSFSMAAAADCPHC
eukprot:15454741-Alexandrium_andersonii.AAC.1